MRVTIWDSTLDIAEPQTDVEVEIRADGKVLWVNVEGKCVLRICRIESDITIKDKREDH